MFKLIIKVYVCMRLMNIIDNILLATDLLDYWHTFISIIFKKKCIKICFVLLYIIIYTMIILLRTGNIYLLKTGRDLMY